MGIYDPARCKDALKQGEILAGAVQFIIDVDSLDEPEQVVIRVLHQYAIVVSQSCDLDWDYNLRDGNGDEKVSLQKLMPNVLLCEAYLAEQVRDFDGINNALWKAIRDNKNIRYQFLKLVEEENDFVGLGIGEMVIDFKNHFTVPTENLYARIERGEVARRSCLTTPYMESLCQRYHGYQMRIALPEQHLSVRS